MDRYVSGRLLAGGMVWLMAVTGALASCSDDTKRRRRHNDDSGDAGADPEGSGGSGKGGSASGGKGSGATGSGATGAVGSGATGSGATGGDGSGATGATGSGATGATSSGGEGGEATGSGGTSSGGTSSAGTGSGGTGQCSGDECMTSCGDGRREIGEECDDGNTEDDDGCSSECEVEPDYTCTAAECVPGGACQLRLPAVFRDFNGSGTTGGHPDFEPDYNSTGAEQGLVEPLLDDDGKPVASAAATSTNGYIHTPESFAQWYRDEAPGSGPIPGEIVLWDDGYGGFVNRWGANGEQWTGYDISTFEVCLDGCAACGEPPAGFVCLDQCTPVSTTIACLIEQGRYDGNPLFFPIDSSPGVLTDTRGEGKIPESYGAAGWPWESTVADQMGITTPIQTATAPFPSGDHNFSFTTELRFWFRYDPNETRVLSFLGDDDVWVFVNGHLAVDLGGWHVPLDATLTLSGGDVSSVTTTSTYETVPTVVNRRDPASEYELEDGNVYEIVVFHAERQAEGSSFKLGLSNFDISRSACGKR